MTRERVFLDIDGVLADLINPLCQAMGFPVASWPAGVYSAHKVLGAEDPHGVWGHPEIMRREFWRDLPVLPWAHELVAEVEQRFGAAPVLLTQTIASPECMAGKHEWIERHFPKLDFWVGRAKHHIAAPGAWLIDDAESNVESWRAHGGEAVLFPARWNHRYRFESDPMPHVLAGLPKTKKVTT